jgi:hypothetical protein
MRAMTVAIYGVAPANSNPTYGIQKRFHKIHPQMKPRIDPTTKESAEWIRILVLHVTSQ